MQSSTPSSARRTALGTVAPLVLALAVCACAAPPAASVNLHIGDAWVRASMGTDNPTAGYMSIRNSGNVDETLIAATVDGAQRVELHRSMAGDSGMMEMHQVDEIAIPAGGSVNLEPGGLHLMIFELDEPLEAGDEVLITLTFAHVGNQAVLADVRAP